MSRLNQFDKIQKEGRDIFIKKNSDYGDAFATHGVPGVLIRINDKLNRYQSITKNSIRLVKEESIRDTLIDLHNYSALALILLDENKNIDLPSTWSLNKNIINEELQKKNEINFIDNCNLWWSNLWSFNHHNVNKD